MCVYNNTGKKENNIGEKENSTGKKENNTGKKEYNIVYKWTEFSNFAWGEFCHCWFLHKIKDT